MKIKLEDISELILPEQDLNAYDKQFWINLKNTFEKFPNSEYPKSTKEQLTREFDV